jgi:hypothetical protein
MSVQAITWAIEQNVQPAGAKLLLIVLANYTNERRQCWPSKATLAADCSMSNSSVCKYLADLQAAGMISIARRVEEGLHKSSIITLHIGGVIRQTDNGYPSDGQGLSSGLDKGLSSGLDTNRHIEPSIEPNGPKSRKRISYPSDFETFWKAYPKDNNMSKSEAFAEWQRITPEDRQIAIASLPAFKTYCKKNPDYRVIHPCRYLKKRRFDGFAPAVVEDDDTWRRRLRYGRENARWYPHDWGPLPNENGCRCPDHLKLPGDGQGWSRQERHAA